LANEAVRRGRNFSLAGRVLQGTLVLLGTLAIAGCAHAPAEHSRVLKVQPPAPEAARAAPPASTPQTTPSDGSPSESSPYAQARAPTDQAPEDNEVAAAQSVAGIKPAQYADLFDRMRNGFKLDASQNRAIEQQLNWFVNNPDYLERAFGRSELYLYHIVTELEARGMPLEIALLPVVESAFEPYAYSRARASGLWQFIPDTGSRFGLKQDWWYDGRRDVVESTRAALDYLQALHDEFNGDWLLAIAAYNCGEAAIERAVEINQTAGRPIDFWSLRLPKETQAYVPKLLAMRRLVLDPESLGLVISPIPNQPYFARVETKGQMDLRVAAEVAGVTPEEVYELNPAYHRWATDPTGPNFLLLPVDGAQVFTQNIGQLSDDERMRATHYRVRHGDTVASVAKHFRTTANVIRELNDVPTGALTVGVDLRVPTANVELPPKVMLAAARVDGRVRGMRRPHIRIHVAHAGDSLWAIARRTGVDVNTLASLNGMHPGDKLKAGQRIKLVAPSSAQVASVTQSENEAAGSHGPSRKVTYTVRTGDTLTQIAKLFQVKVAQILSWNSMASKSAIVPGQKLTIRVAGHG
jgi:membrane-bound lytic murein transglycosylase D